MPHALIVALALVVQAPAEPFAGKVVGISDGDTLTVLRYRQQVKVRLHGVDAPEQGQPFGAASKRRASDLAFGSTVTVHLHDVDRYGRTVAAVELADGRDLGRELVRGGLAWHYPRYAPRDADLRRLQAEAKAARRGLWAEAGAVAPWDWRKGQGRGDVAPGSVVGNRRSRLYHAADCRGVRDGEGDPHGHGRPARVGHDAEGRRAIAREDGTIGRPPRREVAVHPASMAEIAAPGRAQTRRPRRTATGRSDGAAIVAEAGVVRRSTWPCGDARRGPRTSGRWCRRRSASRARALRPIDPDPAATREFGRPCPRWRRSGPGR